jgi:uncharacterized membrane protein
MSAVLSDFDVGAVVVSLVVFFAYHINLYIVNPKCFGGRVPFGVNLKNAKMWIRKHKEMSESPNVLLAIQTLRNTMMAAVFIGGNAIVIAYGLANDYHNVETYRLQLRSLVIMVLMFSSFLCWANVVRLCSVLGYMIGTIQYSEKLRKEAIEQERAEFEALEAQKLMESGQDGEKEVELAPAVKPKAKSFFKSKYAELDNEHHGDSKIEKLKFVSSKIPDIFQEAVKMIKMMTIYFSFGFRLMFVSIPFAFYAAGPVALCISSLCLLLFLRSYDYMRHYDPEDE